MNSNSKGYDVVSKWNYINSVGRNLVRLPPDDTPILIKSAGEYYAGRFTYDEDDFGFYVNQDGEPTLILAEDIYKWMLIVE